MIRVVVVEDETVIRTGLVLLTPWERYGAEVIGEAADGVEGERLVARLDPDLVVTDIRMPGADGIEMIRRLRGRSRAVFIILTSYAEFSYAKEAIDLGVLSYVLKPVDDDEFGAAIGKAAATIRERAESTRHDTERNAAEAPADQSFPGFFSLPKDDFGDSRLAGAVALIQDRYMTNLTAHEAAASLGISESTFSRLFRAHTGYTFLEYLTNVRMKAALDLLADRRVRIYEIADRVGYADYRHFSEVFKRIFGHSPSEFRKGS